MGKVISKFYLEFLILEEKIKRNNFILMILDAVFEG